MEYYEKNPYRAVEFLRPKNYIKDPKPDGYRSIYLICRYQGNHQKGAYKGLRIEIQLRSSMQLEKENKDKPHIQTVMVKLDSIRELKRAYPGCYSDTQRFIAIIEAVCEQMEKNKETKG